MSAVPNEADAVPAAGVTPLPGGLLFAHGVACERCRYGHCALWGFAPLGSLPPNAICPSCGHKWTLSDAFHAALTEVAKLPRIAALLDADNIEPAMLAELRGWFEARGELIVFRAYGNQNTFAGPVWEDAIAAGLDLVITEVRPQAADMTIAVDLGILAVSRLYNELFVVSGDRALSIAAEHAAARFGSRQLVYCGQPLAIIKHVEQCRLGIKHARVEELVLLLQLLLFERGRRERSDNLHRALLDNVPWFHARIYGHESFVQFVAEHFPVERGPDGHYYVSLKDEHDPALDADGDEIAVAEAATRHGHRRRRRA